MRPRVEVLMRLRRLIERTGFAMAHVAATYDGTLTGLAAYRTLDKDQVPILAMLQPLGNHPQGQCLRIRNSLLPRGSIR